MKKTVRVAALLLGASAMTLAASAASRPFSDPARGFSMTIPDGWSDLNAQNMTESADHAVRCTISAQPSPQTASMSQDDINAMIARTYTKEVWERQFFVGGATGTISESGITQMEQFNAPWARGMVTYPGSGAAKFGTILLMAPGKLASVSCIGDAYSYDNNYLGIITVLNNLRPL